MLSRRRAMPRYIALLSAVSLGVVLVGCGEDELASGPPTVLQTRVTAVGDTSAAEAGDLVAITVEAWVDDPNEDITRVYIDAATTQLFLDGSPITPPVDLTLVSEERSQGRDLLVNQYWSTEVQTAWSSDESQFTVTVVDADGQTANKTERWSPMAADDDDVLTAEDYFPLAVGSTWDYADRLGEATYTVSVTDIRRVGDYDWFVIDDGGAEVLARVDVLGDLLRRYTVDDAVVYGEVSLDPDRLVRRPWDTKGVQVDANGDASVQTLYIEIEATSAPVLAPAGSFTCLKLRRSFDEDFAADVVEIWYAPGVGVVRKRLVSDTLEPYDYELVAYDLAE